MKYTDRARLGPNCAEHGEKSAEQFMAFTSEERERYKGNLYCRFCNEKMSFIAGKKGNHRPYFKHFRGAIGEKCKNTKYVSPLSPRGIDTIEKILRSQKTIGVKGHKYYQKNKKPSFFTPRDLTQGPQSETKAVLEAQNKKIIKEDPYDMSIEEILEQLISGKDLSDKELFFYGKTRLFDEVVINVHKIDEKIKKQLNDGEPRIYWGDFYKICCEKRGRDCNICELSQVERKHVKVKVFCGKWHYNEPRILFNEECSTSLLKKYITLTQPNPHGCLAVISDHIEKHTHPVIFVEQFQNKVYYLDQSRH